nr:hypothetical protein KPHV_40560 [Kitasatospora purpeofusca]
MDSRGRPSGKRPGRKLHLFLRESVQVDFTAYALPDFENPRIVEVVRHPSRQYVFDGQHRLSSIEQQISLFDDQWGHDEPAHVVLPSLEEKFYERVRRAVREPMRNERGCVLEPPRIESTAGDSYTLRRALQVLERGYDFVVEELVWDLDEAVNGLLPFEPYGPFAGLGSILYLHKGWLQAQAERVALELLLAVLWEAISIPEDPPLVEEPRTWVCVCGSERLAAPLVPRGPDTGPLPTSRQQGCRTALSLAA